MKFLRKFNEHTSYEAEVNVGGIDFKIPNVSYCKDVKDVHFNPYNLIKFYVGEVTGTTPQTVSIYTETTSIPIQVSEGKKWYTYVLPKDKGLYQIVGDSVKNIVIKANISYSNTDLSAIISNSTVEASFKGSDTSNVTDMDYMFSDCNSLKSLDLSGWNTSNVTRMSGMFSNCRSLTSLDLSSFDTSNVTSMGSMFDGCSGLASLDLRNFNTSNVTDMGGMFYGCDGLTSLDLSNFNTSNVTKMNLMFKNCSNLTSLDLSKWDISEGTIINNMFEGCSNSLTIRMKGCSEDTINKVTSVKPSGASISTE